jgi:hypothetical protein
MSGKNIITEKLFPSNACFLQSNAKVMGGDLPVSWSKITIGVRPGVYSRNEFKAKGWPCIYYKSSSAAHVSSICILSAKPPGPSEVFSSNQSWSSSKRNEPRLALKPLRSPLVCTRR